ncbi:MAG: hypothetical protein DMG49_01865 [Acidobacteria bacterium]|nr:MAG: hypothetical protein DMG49_01865 [Acidobacteriota bacterium]
MPPVVRTLIFTVFLPGFWTVMVPYRLLPCGVRPDVCGARPAGGLLAAAGISLRFACAFWGLAPRGNGTPLPLDPGKKLVVEEPFGIRSVAFMMLGISFRGAGGIGGGFYCGCELVRVVFRGAGAEAEIRRGIRKVLPAGAATQSAVIERHTRQSKTGSIGYRW